MTIGSGGATVTLTVLSKATGAIERTTSFAVPGIPADTGLVVTPVFSPDSSVVSMVVAITVKTNRRMVSKADPRTNGTRMVEAFTLQSRHALAYLDMRTGSLAGPFYLPDEGTLAISTAVATKSELFIWTITDPVTMHLNKGYKNAATLPRISVFPFGTGDAKFTVPSLAPWPSGEPAVALPSGDAARLVNARTLQVISAKNGDATEVNLTALSASRAKPTPATMTARTDGTMFISKAGIGRAVHVDPARSFGVKSHIQFPAPASVPGGPLSKVVMSPDGNRVYALGAASEGGLSAYDGATGALVAAYTHGAHYTGVYQLSSGTLLAVGAENPRLSYFSPALEPLGTADANLTIAEVY